MIADYFREIEKRIADLKIIVEKSIDFKEFSSDEGMVRGKLLFVNGYLLEFMEYICIGKEKPKYRFHLKDRENKMVFRYDNAPHHKVSTFPHHKHTPGGVEPSGKIGFIEVLEEVEKMIVEKAV